MARGMKPINLLLPLGALLAIAGTSADAQRRGDADAVYQGTRSGTLMSPRAIENRVVPQMKARGADYIGSEFDSEMGRYRLKFMRDGAVIWVDVDGRTGAIVGRAGD
jgi:hypothetical protein